MDDEDREKLDRVTHEAIDYLPDERAGLNPTQYLLARICVALERLAEAQETIAATPFEACGGFEERDAPGAQLERAGAFRAMQDEAVKQLADGDE